MKILTLMPAYKIMDIEAVKSLTALQSDIYNRGDNINIAYISGFNTVLARTALINYAAKQEDVDYVLWLDSDHIYKASYVYELISKIEKNNLEMLSAGYLTRGPRNLFAHGSFIDNGNFKQHKKGTVSGLIDCDIIGFGFLVMKQDFVKRMVNKYGKDLFKMDYSNNTTEDIYFCRKMKEEGIRICYDADIIVGHLMTVVNE